MTRLRIGLDARECLDPCTGMGRFALEVIPQLVARGNHDYVVWLPPGRPPPLSLRGRVETVASAVTAYHPLEHLLLAREIRRHRLDLFHALTYALPLRAGVATTITLFDVVPLLYPDQYGWRARAYWQAVVPRTAAAARRIVTLSHHSRADIVRHLPVAADRIDVVPTAVGAPFGLGGDGGARLRARYPFLERPFVLVHGNQRPHKNIGAAIAAWDRLGRRPDRPLLVLSGGSALAAPRVDGAIVRLGPVDDSTLVELYRNALLYLLPSLYEGAGLTPLEAMACGTPCALADRAALPEVYARAAAFTAADPDSIAATIGALCDDPARRAEFTAAGLALARQRSWAATAAALEAVFELAAGSACTPVVD